MNKADCCSLCQDPVDLVTWHHPDTDEDIALCSFCARAIIGTCHECHDILTSVDRYGVDEKGNKLCSKCTAAHERSDEAGRGGG